MEYRQRRHAMTIVHGRKSHSHIDDLALLAQRKPLAVLLTSSGALFVAWISTHVERTPSPTTFLLYDHISWRTVFSIVRSLTNDHPTNETNDRVRWNFLPRGRPLRVLANLLLECQEYLVVLDCATIPQSSLLSYCTKYGLIFVFS